MRVVLNEMRVVLNELRVVLNELRVVLNEMRVVLNETRVVLNELHVALNELRVVLICQVTSRSNKPLQNGAARVNSVHKSERAQTPQTAFDAASA
jgi:hypothetical protein